MSQLSIFDPKPDTFDPFEGIFDPFADLFGSDGSEDPDGLRYYQRDAEEKGWAVLQKRRALIVMATGLGKTQVFCALIRRAVDLGWNCLVITHRNELGDQARRRLEQMVGTHVEVEQGEWRASPRARVVAASAASIMQQGRLDRMGADRFQLIVVDEAHHYISPGFRRPLEFFKAKVLGVTATPDRGDERAMGQVFEEVAYVMDITDGIDHGYLVPITGERILLSEMNLDAVGTSKDDLNQTQLDSEVVKVTAAIVSETLRLQPTRRCIGFFPGVKSAEFACLKFNEAEPGSTCFVSGDTDPDERKRIIRDFRAGKYLRLMNCNIATEGFDVPDVSLILQATPTKSRNKYAQQTGRGTRTLPGVVDHIPGIEGKAARRAAIAASAKPVCYILDFVGNSSKHDLCTPEELLGGNYSELEVKQAKKMRNPGEMVADALERARAELVKLAKAASVTFKSKTTKFDPFRVLDIPMDDESRNAMRFGGRPATEAQLEFLRNKKVPAEDLDGLSFKAAQQLMRAMDERKKKGLCSYPQLRQLQRFGVTEMDITWGRADAAMQYLKAKNWANIDPKALNDIIHHRRQSGED